MKKSNKNNTGMLLVLLIVILILAYKFMFAPVDDGMYLVDDVALGRVEITLQQVQNINFDTTVVNDQKFISLQSIETPLVSMPIGRNNPFSSGFGSN